MPTAAEQVYVTVEGQPAELAAGRVVSVSIEQSLLLPDAFNIVLNSGLEWLHDDTFGIGKEVRIEMEQEGAGRRTLLAGEVTGLFPRMTGDNQVLLHVRGYDRSHRLQRGRKTRAFIQSTDSDIAQRIASELGLGADIETTSDVHAHVFQKNQTDLEFLRDRAGRIGFQVGVFESDLYFKPVGKPTAGPAPAGPVQLKWGDNLEEFEVARTTPGQATEVTVRGWDPQRKEVIVGQASSSQSGPEVERAEAGSEAVKSAFGLEAPMTVVREGVATQGEAERLAQVICDELHGCYTTAEGLAGGNPDIIPGAEVEISGVGVFDGKYVVSSANHRFDRNGYRTEFLVGGSRLPAGPNGGGAPISVPGVFLAVGIVTNNEDDEDLGRVKVKLPSLADDLESHWCRIVSPMTGDGRGFFSLPEVNDEVLVAFEQHNQPIVLGSLWNGIDKPPLGKSDAVSGGKVVQRVWKSRSGHFILLDDTDGAEQVVVEDKNGNQIVLDAAGNNLKVKVAKDIEIEADGNIKIKAGGNLEVEAAANMTLKAGGKLDVQGSVINLN